MSLQAFQRAVVELTLAPHMADALRGGNLAALADYELTGRERERLIAIAGQRGMAVHRTLARGNRLEIIFEAFPMTCILLRPVLRAIVDELWAQHRPTHYQLAEEADTFIAFLTRKMAEGSLEMSYLPDVFGYELACRALILRARTDPDAEFETVVPFEHAPGPLLTPLANLTAPPAGLPRGSWRVAVRLRDSRFSYDVIKAPSAPHGSPTPGA